MRGLATTYTELDSIGVDLICGDLLDCLPINGIAAPKGSGQILDNCDDPRALARAVPSVCPCCLLAQGLDRALAPDQGYVLYYRGLSLLAKGEDDRAIGDLNQAVVLTPRNPLIFEGLGLAFLRQGQFDQAIADFDQALKLRPTLANALYGRGLAKLKKSENPSGEADVAKAIKPNVAEEFARYGL